MIDCHNSFAPVVNWSTVRLIIMMAEISGWESNEVYYVLALYQVPIDSDVYLHLPANLVDMLKTGVEDKSLVFTTGGSNGKKCYANAGLYGV